MFGPKIPLIYNTSVTDLILEYIDHWSWNCPQNKALGQHQGPVPMYLSIPLITGKYIQSTDECHLL